MSSQLGWLKAGVKCSDRTSQNVCACLSTGRGCSGRGKLHHPLLCADGLRGMSHLNRDTGDVLPGGPVNLQGCCQKAQTGCLWTCFLHNFGLSHQGLLSGWQPGCTEGKVLKLNESNPVIPGRDVWYCKILSLLNHPYLYCSLVICLWNKIY